MFSTPSVLVGGVVRLHSKWSLVVVWKKDFQKWAVSFSFVPYIFCSFDVVHADFVTSSVSFQLIAELQLRLVQWLKCSHAKSFFCFFLFFYFCVFLLENYYGTGKTVYKSKSSIFTFGDACKWMPFFFNLGNVFWKFSISLQAVTMSFHLLIQMVQVSVRDIFVATKYKDWT